MSKKRSFKHFDEAARTVIEITENGFTITRQKVAEFLHCSEAVKCPCKLNKLIRNTFPRFIT